VSGVSNGWTQIFKGQSLNSTAIGPFYQICLTAYIITNQFFAGSPPQLLDVQVSATLPGESIDDWNLDVDSTTIGTNSPCYVGFTCVNVPGTLPANIFIKGNTVGLSGFTINDNWLANPSLFQYFDGTTWNALSSLASAFVVGRKIRYNVATPPGAETQVSLRYKA
jgi:hypothetical protein